MELPDQHQGTLEASKPDPEVPEKAKRRRFSTKYKLRILSQADDCTKTGQLGELLRREGLYSSQLSNWRKQRNQGALEGLKPKRRGRKAKPRNPEADELKRLRAENERLEERLRQAEAIIEVQKKLSEVLGIPLNTDEKK